MARASLIQPCQHSSVRLTERDIAALAGEDVNEAEEPEYEQFVGPIATQGTKGKGFDMRPHGAHAYALSR